MIRVAAIWLRVYGQMSVLAGQLVSAQPEHQLTVDKGRQSPPLKAKLSAHLGHQRTHESSKWQQHIHGRPLQPKRRLFHSGTR